ncbi:hypothetical protein [Moorena sp. SIO3I8]|uniref:hypothetical protein n=1 Tax=Moorena sp. SIO3I8 TaxID=2607833 RepID=UPI0025CF8F62|nr:hypothetical protein [Moorena sp. SIO3I8]
MHARVNQVAMQHGFSGFHCSCSSPHLPISPSPHTPYSLFPTPYSLLPIPYSLFPAHKTSIDQFLNCLY